MTPREVVKATLEFRPTGEIPYQLWPLEWWPGLAERVDRHFGSPWWRERVVNYQWGWHSAGDHGTVDLGDGTYRSPWGYVYRPTMAHLERAALAAPSLDGYVWPEPESLADWGPLADQHAANAEKFRMCGMAFGFFERGMRIRGMEPLLMDMVDHPQFVHDLFDGYLRVRLKLIDLIIDRIRPDAICDGGDDCDQRGVIMGLDRWREFIGCRTKIIADHVHAKGLPLEIHQCGNARPLVEDYLAMGVDCLDPIQPEALDVYELKRHTHGRMALMGGLGVQQLLPHGTPEQVRAETLRLIRQLGAGGGFILMPAKPMGEEIPTANAAALIETVLEHCGPR